MTGVGRPLPLSIRLRLARSGHSRISRKTSREEQERPRLPRSRAAMSSTLAGTSKHEADRIASPLEPQRSRLAPGRKPDNGLEATPEHALPVEGHLRRVHGVFESRILHHRLADAVPIL